MTLSSQKPSQVLIQVSNLEVVRDGKPLLSNVSLVVKRGEITTIVGPNGSGKSTLLRALVGALQPTSGHITKNKQLKIGYVPQKLAIDATMPLSVDRFLDLPTRVNAADKLKAVETSGISGLLNRQMTHLSGGQFQRVLLARAVLSRPEVLILDEANQGLDQPATAAFYKLIASLRDDLNCAVLMVSHDLHVVMAASDQVICLNGHICCQGTPQAVSAAPAYRALFGAGTQGTMALYKHAHDHSHDHSNDHSHDLEH